MTQNCLLYHTTIHSYGGIEELFLVKGHRNSSRKGSVKKLSLIKTFFYVFGRINEYFLTQFADQKAHDNGEFFTPVIFYIMNCGDSVATIMLHRIILYCIQFLHNPRIRIRQD